MDAYDRNKVDEVILALMYLALDNANRAWKSYDWDALDRLYEKGWISNPRSKAKSVALTEEGLAEAARLFEQYFSKTNDPPDRTAR